VLPNGATPSPLHRLSLVPQDPVVFSGSFRSNLDPFGQAGSDADVWGALRQAGLDGMVRATGVSVCPGGGGCICCAEGPIWCGFLGQGRG
jgi:ABC-type transport system involved in cytochrome bd biosynthesis fused ATPase/permease subunit